MPVRRRLTPEEVSRVHSLASRLQRECEGIDTEALSELANIFAEAAAHLQSPAKSFAKRIPYYLANTLSHGALEAVIKASNQRVAELRRDAATPSAPDLQPLLSIEEVAPLLRLTVGVMEKLLLDWAFRRDCGWPQWVRGKWYFHPDAFGIRRAEYFHRLPEEEPFPVPPHCNGPQDGDLES